MGRYDEWFISDDDQGQQREPADDSAPAEAPAEIDKGTGSHSAHEHGEPKFSEIHQQESNSAVPGPVDGDDFGVVDSPAQPDIAPVPADIAGREQNLEMRPRFKGHSPLNAQIREDWIKVIETHADAFQALLYRPSNGTYGVVDTETDLESFTEINNNQRDLTYEEPELVWVIDSPDGRDSFRPVDADGEQDGITDDVMVLRVASRSVTVGSILEWNEELSNGVARRWWYVHRIFAYGTQHVGSLYYCIPARNFDTTTDGVQ